MVQPGIVNLEPFAVPFDRLCLRYQIPHAINCFQTALIVRRHIFGLIPHAQGIERRYSLADLLLVFSEGDCLGRVSAKGEEPGYKKYSSGQRKPGRQFATMRVALVI